MITMFRWIRNLWNKGKSDVERYPVTIRQIQGLLRNERIKKTKNFRMEVSDMMYLTCDYNKLKEIVKICPIRYKKYKFEAFDCENYSRAVWGYYSLLFPRLPIGYCHVIREDGSKHALNFAIFKTPSGRTDFVYLEPQDNHIFYANYKNDLMIV